MSGLAISVDVASLAGARLSARKATPSRHGSMTSRTIGAAAMLEFDVNSHGICGAFALHGLHRRTAGEPALVAALERRLAAVDLAGGRLVTFDGQRDLGAIRIAAMRTRQFSIGGAAAWLRDDRDSHEDMMLVLSPWSIGRRFRPRLRDAWFERDVDTGFVRGPARRESIQAELDVLHTMVVYLHVLSERHRSLDPLSCGVAALADMLIDKVRHGPHFWSILHSEIFRRYATPVF